MNATTFSKLILSGVFAAAAFGTTPVTAQEDMGGRGEERGGMNMGGGPGRMAMDEQDNGLTDEQNAKLKKIRTDCMAKLKPLAEEMKTKRAAVTAELSKENYSAATARKLQAEITAVETKMSDLKIEQLISIRAIMSGEEFAKIAKSMSRMGPGMMGGGMGGPGKGGHGRNSRQQEADRN